MSKTLHKHQENQSKALNLLEKLQKFIDEGEVLGLSIPVEFKSKLEHSIKHINEDKLKIALVGGFSEGKTSIAAAWLEKLDPSSMKISAQESSNEVKIFEIGDDFILIDTPGLFGFKEQQNITSQEIEKYKDITKKYVSEAHIVLYVMNSKNPIKDSHQEDLHWLFRTLNLLPRTVFVLSRFDEVADVEDEADYAKSLTIKQDNVRNRLRDLIQLTENELKEIAIVGVSANPFDEGTEYWLANLDEFKKLSHIHSLQDATHEIVRSNGGLADVVEEARKSIISDVLYKHLPVVESNYRLINDSLEKLEEVSVSVGSELKNLNHQISQARSALRDNFVNYFADLITQVKGTSLETIDEFLTRQIGDEGIVISTRIQSEFERQTRAISISLDRNVINFDAELNSVNSAFNTLGKKGLANLLANGSLFNATTVKTGRDVLVSGAQFLGADLSKALKFKPWGAVKFANKLNGAIAVLGIAMEAWDSYQQAKKQEEFDKAKVKLVENLNAQQKELLALVSSENFMSQFFPSYNELNQKVKDVQTYKEDQIKRKARFEEWKNEGNTIEAEFSVISRT